MVVVALVALVLIALHTAPVQRRLLDLSIRELERRFNLTLSSDRLDFNLVTRRVEMTNVRLSAAGHGDAPFFTATTVLVKLPWAVFRGRLRFDEIAVTGGTFAVVRDAAGVSNLPGGRGTSNPDAPTRRLDIAGLRIDTLDFSYLDLGRDIEIRAPRIRTALERTQLTTPPSGPFGIDGEMLVRVRQTATRFKPVAGTMAFTGSDVILTDLTLDSHEGSFLLGGQVTRVLDRPTLDLTFKGTADIANATQWAPSPIHVDGSGAIDATIKGAPTAFALEARVTVPDGEVGTERNVAITALAQLTPSSLHVPESTIRPRTGGAITATVDLPFGAGTAWAIDATWRDLDAATAFRLAEVRPLPFGAALAGTARISRAANEPFALAARNTSTPRQFPGTAPLAGEVDFRIAGNRWSARQQHRMGSTRVDGDLGGVWNRAAAARSTFEGDLDVQSGDLGEAARYAELFGFALPDIVTGASGPLEADVALSGTFTEPRFTGALRSDGVTLPSLGSTAVTATFDAWRRGVSATNVNARIGTASARGDVNADLVSRALTGRFDVEAPSVAEMLTGMPDAFRLEGPLSATATLAGTVDAPDIAITATGANLTLAGQPVTGITADVHVIEGGLRIDALTVNQGDGALKAAGRYLWGPRSFELDASGQGLQWRGTLARLGDAHVGLNLALKAAGTIDRPVGGAEIRFDVSEGLAGEIIDRGTINVRLTGDDAVITGHVPALGALINATVTPRAPYNYDAVVVMNRIDLVPMLALAGLPRSDVAGMMSLSATAKGTLSAPRESRAFVNLQDIQAQASGVPLRLTAPARIAWDGAALTVDDLDLAVGQGQLRASGRLADGGVQDAQWQAAFSGELGDLLRIGRPFGVPVALDGTGPVTFAWRSTGGIDESTATIKLSNGAVTWDALPPVRDIQLAAAFDGQVFAVESLTAAWQDGRLDGTARIPRAVLMTRDAATPVTPGDVRVRVVGLTEEALLPWLGSVASIDGRVSATLDAVIGGPALESVNGTLTLDEAAFTLAGVDVSQARPARIDLRGGLVTLQDMVFNIAGSPLAVTGTAHLTPSGKETLDLAVRGTADLRVLSAFAPTTATEGEARINLGIGGPLRAPVLSGRIDLANTEVALREPRILLSEINGTIAFDGQRVLLDSVGGTLNGGVLTLDGGFLLDGFRPASGGLTAQVQGAAIDYPEGLQSEADALVTLRPSDTGWSLTGEVRIERSAYNRTISIPAILAARGARAPSAARDDRWISALRLNLFVITQEDLRIDNNYGRLEAGAALRVGGTVANPVLAGRATLREGGEVYLAGNTFHVSRGSISFANPNRIVPEFDIELQTRVSGADLSLTLQGPIDRLETEVRSSDPAVDSREAMAMLFGGFQGEDAVALLSSELLGATGRAIGLDTLRVERGFDDDEFRADPGLIATETDPSARLTLSKRLRPDVELTLSQSLRESGGLSAIVSYKPRRNIELRVASRDNVDRSVALRHEITFGGAGAATATSAATGPQQPLVSSVTITGEFAQPESEIRARLSLDPGERFAFHLWQEDIDRLRAWYHEQLFYNVRIRGSREVSGDGQGVALEYRIEPGPVAELTIEGHEVEPALDAQIREAWQRTIFDGFLLEDIRTRVQRHLIEENVLNATVDARVAESTPQRKHIVVSIGSGTPVARRAIRYSGNAAYSADRLDRVVADAGLALDGWLDPARVAEAVAAFYRDEGYLAAEVRGAAPIVENNRGILPITVVEGARFVTGEVTFAGVSPARAEAVRSATRLEPKSPFVALDVDAARRRLENVYAREGFNTVQVEVDSRPDLETGTVAVSFAVLEGLQQILREVTTEGAERTRAGVIRRALRLEIGEPVTLADWSQARKRLYDTNVFRQVDIEPVPLPPTTEDSAAGLQPVRAVIRVVEYPVWRLRYGAQLNDELVDVADADGKGRLQSLGILADLQNQNVFGRAITAGIAGRYERDRQAGSLFTSNGSFFGLPIRSSGFLFTSRQRFELSETLSVIDKRVGMSAEQRWRVFRRSEVLWSYRFERSHTFDPDPSPFDPIPIDTVVQVSRVNAAIVFDRRDDPTAPTEGWFNSTNYEQAFRLLGSDYANAKLLVQQSAYQRFGQVVVAGRAQLGAGFGDEPLIASERFMLGGATTVRGYAENSLGPRVAGLPAGGDALLNLNGEVRFPVKGWVQGVGFIDAGNIFVERSDLSFADLTVGYGFGLRLASPFAMLRVDFGIPARTLDAARRANRFKSGRLYLGIGHVF